MPDSKQNEHGTEEPKDVPLPPSSAPGTRPVIASVEIRKDRNARDLQEVREHLIYEQAAATAVPLKLSTKGGL